MYYKTTVPTNELLIQKLSFLVKVNSLHNSHALSQSMQD